MIISKIYNNNQTTIPSEIRKKYNLNPNTIVEWIDDDNGEIKIRFREKSKLRDIINIIDINTPTDAVKIKKMSKHEIKKVKNNEKKFLL